MNPFLVILALLILTPLAVIAAMAAYAIVGGALVWAFSAL